MRPDLTEEGAHARLEQLRDEASAARTLRRMPRRRLRSLLARLLVRLAVRLEPDLPGTARPSPHGLPLTCRSNNALQFQTGFACPLAAGCVSASCWAP